MNQDGTLNITSSQELLLETKVISQKLELIMLPLMLKLISQTYGHGTKVNIQDNSQDTTS
jgi:hypothetical protein